MPCKYDVGSCYSLHILYRSNSPLLLHSMDLIVHTLLFHPLMYFLWARFCELCLTDIWRLFFCFFFACSLHDQIAYYFTDWILFHVILFSTKLCHAISSLTKCQGKYFSVIATLIIDQENESCFHLCGLCITNHNCWGN